MTLDALSELRADADDRQAVLRSFVERALGRFAGQSTITVNELAEIMHCARSTAYEAIKRGAVPSLRVGERRVVVPIPALVALLLDVQTNNGENAIEADDGTSPASILTIPAR